jgi:hypothetical protein
VPEQEPAREERDFDRFLAEVFGASERAGAIVAAAQVEDALASAIRGRLRELSDTQDDAVFDGATAPLNTFSAKIELGFALGIYDQPVAEDLRAIKAIRNRFAHVIAARAFQDDQVARQCRKLHCPAFLAAEKGEEEEQDPRARFQSTVGQLFMGLALIGANPARPTPPVKWAQLLTYPRRPGATSPEQKRRVRPSRHPPSA